MSETREEQVRAQLTRLAFLASGWEDRACLLGNMTASEITESVRAALALLDAGRKDRERVDWLEHQAEYGRVTLDTNNPEFDNSEPPYTVYASAKGGRKFGETLRAAIDTARGA